MIKRLKIPQTPGNFSDAAASGIDMNHMIYGAYLGVQYVFNDTLDANALSRAVGVLCAQFPLLTGRIDYFNKTIVRCQNPLFLSHQVNYPGSAIDHAQIGTIQTNRFDFVDEPSRRHILKGDGPLITIKLTEFSQGGSILGLAINHVITDATGFHKLTHHLAAIYRTELVGSDHPDWPFFTRLKAFEFGTNRNRNEWVRDLKIYGWSKPAKMQGVLGAPMRWMIVFGMSTIAKQNRLVISFTRDQIAQLKDTVHAESGEDWISTNVAISAHFASIMARLLASDRRHKPFRIGQLLDLRDRYFEDDRSEQSNFIGNAILIHTEKAKFPGDIKRYDRGAFARFFKKTLSEIDTQSLQHRMDLIADSLRLGYNYPGLEMSDPLLAVNNQSKMPVYDVEFGNQRPIRVIPQDVGDNIMFFPAPDGGMEIYIRDILNPTRQAKLETTQWQDRIFDF